MVTNEYEVETRAVALKALVNMLDFYNVKYKNTAVATSDHGASRIIGFTVDDNYFDMAIIKYDFSIYGEDIYHFIRGHIENDVKELYRKQLILGLAGVE